MVYHNWVFYFKTLYIITLGSPTKPCLSRQSSHDSNDDELEIVYDDGSKSRNPVRRSNSSPEMANWKNPFVHQKTENSEQDNPDEDNAKKNKKDLRVSCEAIPEEIAGMGLWRHRITLTRLLHYYNLRN